ncbi:hypothetical protein B0J18DRAFT_147532 [Chaetomium sp. MPI-SDFR-AT-0129]|nr:hypothetical protein B0J18DRAFT_147532 [Chaetomium sp. MPI-SDFR-AT-0129]
MIHFLLFFCCRWGLRAASSARLGFSARQNGSGEGREQAPSPLLSFRSSSLFPLRSSRIPLPIFLPLFFVPSSATYIVVQLCRSSRHEGLSEFYDNAVKMESKTIYERIGAISVPQRPDLHPSCPVYTTACFDILRNLSKSRCRNVRDAPRTGSYVYHAPFDHPDFLRRHSDHLPVPNRAYQNPPRFETCREGHQSQD